MAISAKALNRQSMPPSVMYGGRRKSFEAEDGVIRSSSTSIIGGRRHKMWRKSELPVIQDGSPLLSYRSDSDYYDFKCEDGLLAPSSIQFRSCSLERSYSDSGFASPYRQTSIEVKRNHSLKVLRLGLIIRTRQIYSDVN